MPSNTADQSAYVWIWLPDATDAVVAGKLEADDQGNIQFNYGQSYLARAKDNPPAIPIYEPELPLKAGLLPLLEGLSMPSCIRDATPDAWGRRVIINKKLGRINHATDTNELGELTYLLESGSNRIGALDFQRSPGEYIPRSENPANRAERNIQLAELLESADRVEQGIPLTAELDQALLHGSSIGGARPKALIEDQDTQYIAKFSSSSDLYSVINVSSGLIFKQPSTQKSRHR